MLVLLIIGLALYWMYYKSTKSPFPLGHLAMIGLMTLLYFTNDWGVKAMASFYPNAPEWSEEYRQNTIAAILWQLGGHWLAPIAGGFFIYQFFRDLTWKYDPRKDLLCSEWNDEEIKFILHNLDDGMFDFGDKKPESLNGINKYSEEYTQKLDEANDALSRAKYHFKKFKK